MIIINEAHVLVIFFKSSKFKNWCTQTHAYHHASSEKSIPIVTILILHIYHIVCMWTGHGDNSHDPIIFGLILVFEGWKILSLKSDEHFVNKV